MIVGIGTDIVRVARLESAFARFGARYAERILGATELDEFATTARRGHFLAKRFAAKEAAAKALGTGFRGAFGLRDIVVDHDPLGGPRLVLGGGARVRAETLLVTRIHVSLSDEEEYAVALVILEAA